MLGVLWRHGMEPQLGSAPHLPLEQAGAQPCPLEAHIINSNNTDTVQHYNLGSEITTSQGTEGWNTERNDRL